MNRIKIFLVAIFVLAMVQIQIHPSLAANYPQPVGYMNDYAGLLSLSDVQKLESELKGFDNQTTDEVVVVTVNSLEGLSARAYTIGLANNWKVGKKIKNNGVVFLVAPNEREVDIEVGSGLEQILTQSDVDNILDNEVVPYLKDDKWSEGIFAGVQGIVNKLNGSSSQNQNIVQNQPVSKPMSSEETKWLLMTIGTIISATLIILVGIWIRGKYKQRKNNQQLLLKCQEKISTLEATYPIVNNTLGTLMQNNPVSVWQGQKESFDKIIVNDLWQELFNIQDLSKKDWKHPDVVKKDIEELDNKIANYLNILERIKLLPNDIENAKTESKNLILSLPENIHETQRVVGQTDVFDETKLSFENAEKKFQSLKANVENIDSSKIDWINLCTELRKLSSNLNNIQSEAESNRMTTARARSEGPKLMEKLPGLIEELERKIDSDDAKRLLADAKIKYNEANSMRSSQDWVQTYLTLVTVNELIDNAERSHRHHIEEIRRREESRRSSYARSSSSYSPGGGGGFGNVGGSRKF